MKASEKLKQKVLDEVNKKGVIRGLALKIKWGFSENDGHIPLENYQASINLFHFYIIERLGLVEKEFKWFDGSPFYTLTQEARELYEDLIEEGFYETK